MTYRKYPSKSLKPITPIQSVPEISKIEGIQPLQGIQPIQPIRSLQPQQSQTQNKQVQTFLSNYSDPTELNSFIDALTNREAVSKKFGEAWGTASTLSGTVAVLSFAGSIIASLIPGGQAVAPVLAKIGMAAAVPAIPAATDVAVEKGIKPILAGKPKEVALNMLMNLGETMDAVANPVKGLVLEGPSGFAKGTGLASGGRVNYDYDTDFFLTDMLLEIVTDPMNWVDFGAGTAFKTATKNAAEPVAKEITQQAVYTVNEVLAKSVGEISTEGAERITKKVSKTSAQVAREWASKNVTDLTEEAKALLLENGRNRIQQSLVQAIRTELPNATEMDIKGILSKMSKSYSDTRMVKGALNQISDIGFDTLSSDVIKGLAATRHYSDSFQKFLTANAFRTSGYGMGIELAKKGFKPIKEWASKTILRKLKVARVFNENTGIDLKQWTKAKSLWEAGGHYVNKITGQLTERNIDTFYECISEQLIRDQSAMVRVLSTLAAKPIEQAAALDTIFKNLYGLDFYSYVDTLEQIVKLEGNAKINFAEYIKFANETKDYIYKAAEIVRSGNTLKSGSALFDVKSLDQLIEKAELKIQEFIKTKKGADLTKTTYALKLGNEYVDSILLQEKNINEVMTAIHTDEAIGNTLKQILNDNNALNENADATLYAAAQTVKRTAASYKNTELLADRIAQLIVPKIPGLNDTALKRYILNEIRGAGALKTTTELYGNIALSVNDLFERLRELTTNYKTHEALFNISDYPELAPQIEEIYKSYLKAQKDAGVENITDLISDEFTHSLYILEERLTQGGLPDLAQSLALTRQNIRDILLSVRMTNERLLGETLVNSKSIFNGAKYRKLVDMGLAVQTITVKENLSMFYMPTDVPNTMLKQLNVTGKAIKSITDAVQQYADVFDDDLTKRIGDVYARFYEYIAAKGSELPVDAYKYLKRTIDPVQQFAQMAHFRQLIKDDNALKSVFKKFVNKDYELDNLFYNPSPLMTTDFAWDGMAQSVVVAEKQFTEELINMSTAYENLSIQSQAITGSFQQMRKIIAESKFDDPRAIQLERYIQKIEPMNKFLKTVEKKYNDLFDIASANLILEDLRKVCNDFPKLNEKYATLIDELDDYWHGKKKFQQDPKYEKAKLGDKYVDEFTPFWNRVIEMQNDIKNTIRAHNDSVYERLDTHYKTYIIRRNNLRDKLHNELLQKNAEAKTAQKQYWKDTIKVKKDVALDELKLKNAEAKARYQEDLLPVKTRQKEDIFKFEREAALAELQHNYQYARQKLRKETLDKFNALVDKAADEYKILNENAPRYLDPKREALYQQYRADIAAVKRARKGEKYIPKQLDVEDVVDSIGVSQDLIYSLREEYAAAINSAEYGRVLELLKQNLKDYSVKDIDELNKWYLTGPINSEIREKVLDEQGNTIGYKVVGKKTKQQLLEEMAHGIIAQPILEEISQLYRATLNTKYEELFAPVSERLFKNYIELRNKISNEIYETYLHSNADYQAISQQYYELFKYRIDYNYNWYQETIAEINLDKDRYYREVFLPATQKNYEEFIQGWEEQSTQMYNEYAQIKAEIKSELRQFDYNSVNPWTPYKKQQEFNKLVNRATNANAKASIYSLLNLDTEKFIEELACRHRFVVLFDDDLSESGIKNAYNNLYHKLKSDGRVYFEHDTNLGCTWIVLDKSQEVTAEGRQFFLNGTPIVRPEYKTDFNEFLIVDEFLNDSSVPSFVETFNNLSDTLESLTGSKLGSSQGEFFSKQMLEKIYDQMPDNIKALFDADDLFSEQFFGAYLFNESVLGTIHNKTKLGMYGSNMVANARNALVQSQCYLKAKNEYVFNVFDSAFSISGKNSIYANYTDKQLLEALQANTDYKLVALVDDPKYGVKVREIQPTTVEAIARARELNAVVVPLQIYKDMYNTVNHRIGSAGAAKLWSRIMYVYKFGFLCRLGAFVRNWVDTNLKSYLEMNDDYKPYMIQAHRIYDTYEEVIDRCQARLNELIVQGTKSYDLPSLTQLYKEYFDEVKPKYLDYETFLELKNKYFSQGVSDNIMREIYGDSTKDGWDMFTNVTGKVTDIGNRTENYNRLATYLYELDRGQDYTSALAKLSKIHFDYSFKTKAEQLVDMIFPFTTFSLRNYSYWIEMLEKHPWLLRNYTHIMKPSWDFKDYTPQELARDKRIQAQILYGQVKLAEFNDKIITFKANPSIQDAIQMFSDPINNVYEKLAAPIAYPLSKATGDYTSPLNVLPVVGPTAQSIKSFVDDKPGVSTSVFGVIPKRTQKTTNIKFSNNNYSGINSYKDKQYRVPNYRKNVVYDAYATKGVTRYRANMYPVIDVYHDVKSKYTVDVYNKIKNKVKTDVYKGIRYSLRLDANRWR